jgi:hypothetical protein
MARRAAYLWRKYLYDWLELLERAELLQDEESRDLYLTELAALATTLRDNQEVWRTHQYLAYILGAIRSLGATATAGTTTDAQTIEPLRSVYHVYALLYWLVCRNEGSLLVGIADPDVVISQLEDYGTIKQPPLWCAVPSQLAEVMETVSHSPQVFLDIVSLGLTTYSIAPFLSGAASLRPWHALLLPTAETWSLAQHWTARSTERFQTALAESLGLSGLVSVTTWADLVRTTQLERRYALFPDRPVMVRLPRHPLIQELLLMEHEGMLIARLRTASQGDMLHVAPAAPVREMQFAVGGTLPTMHVIHRGESSTNYALSYFVGLIYHALVTAETLTADHDSLRPRRRSTGVSGTTKGSAKAPTDITAWQIIPRRVYRADDDTDMLVERRDLTADEASQQERQRHVFDVIGHPRTLSGGRKPSPAQLQRAQDLGVFLLEGQTFVRPYRKGQRDEGEPQIVGEGDLAHFVMREGSLRPPLEDSKDSK